MIDPSIYLEDLEKMIKIEFPSGDYKTLAGLIYKQLDRVPEIGDTVEISGCRITVESMEQHHILQVILEQNIVQQTMSAELIEKGNAPGSE